MNLEEDHDTHVCLNCQTTIMGLENYVSHKKNECPARKPDDHSQKNKVDQPIMLQVTTDVTAHVPSLVSSQMSPNTQSRTSASALAATALSPGSSRVVDPNMVLYTGNGDKHLNDFFSSLELQSRDSGHGTNLNKSMSENKPDHSQNDGLQLNVHKGSAMVSDPVTKHFGVDEGLEQQKSLRIASILNDLGFSSDSDALLSDDDILDFSDEEYQPPRCHTGGKWKPGSPPYRSRGKWRPGGKPYTVTYAGKGKNNEHMQDGKSEEPTQSGGKWKPGEGPHYSGGKWKHGEESHSSGGKWRSGDGPQHTGGKWRSGDGPQQTGGKWHSDLQQHASGKWKSHLSQHAQEEPPQSGGKWHDVMSHPVGSKWKSHQSHISDREPSQSDGKWHGDISHQDGARWKSQHSHISEDEPTSNGAKLHGNPSHYAGDKWKAQIQHQEHQTSGKWHEDFSAQTGGKWRSHQAHISEEEPSETGGKWPPGEISTHTGGKWRHGEDTASTGGKWKSRAFTDNLERELFGNQESSYDSGEILDSVKETRGLPTLFDTIVDSVMKPKTGKYQKVSSQVPSEVSEASEPAEAVSPACESQTVKTNAGSVANSDQTPKCVEAQDIHCLEAAEIEIQNETEDCEETADPGDNQTEKFTCHTCNKSLSSKASYERHFTTTYHFKRASCVSASSQPVRQRKHCDDDMIECPTCNRSFYSKYNYVRHLLTPSHEKRVQSENVPYLLDETYQVLLLRQSVFQCRVCSFYCNLSSDLHNHMKTSEHVENVDNLVGPLLCVRCRFFSTSNSSMLQHMLTEEHQKMIQEAQRPCVIRECRYQISCQICGLKLHSAAQLTKHIRAAHQPTSSRRRGKYPIKPRCAHCNVQCQSRAALAIHIRRRHTKEKPFNCRECNIGFADKYSLSLHEKSRRHLNVILQIGDNRQSLKDPRKNKPQTRYKCDHCDFRTNKYKDLRPHYIECHTNKTFFCQACDLTFTKVNFYNIHLKSASHHRRARLAQEKPEQRWKCPKCTKSFFGEDDRKLQLHLLSHESIVSEQQLRESETTEFVGIHAKFHNFLRNLPRGNILVTCPECKKTLGKGNIYSHLRQHDGSLPFRCMYCEQRFAASGVLQRHLKRHLNILDHVCPVCNKAFVKKSNLKDHMYTHNKSAPKPYTCDICNQSFHLAWRLKSHMKIHQDKPFKCGQKGCRQSFTYKSALMYHVRVHTDERPFLCDLCGYSAKVKQQLVRHKRTHTGERRYSCEYCPYKAMNSTHLRRHMRIHIGSKPYKCPYCDYTCNTHENIRKHIRKTKKHAGLKIYPCRMCSYGTDDAKEFKDHILTVHNIDEKDIGVSSVYSGLYDNSFDPSTLPEGARALPVKEKQDKSEKITPIKEKSPNKKAKKAKQQTVDHAYSCSQQAQDQSNELRPLPSQFPFYPLQIDLGTQVKHETAETV